MIVAVILMAIVALAVGFFVGLSIDSRNTAKELLRTYGIDRGTVKRYRAAAQLIHDLVYVNDLSGDLPVLPAPLQKRAEAWLSDHRESIEKGK